MTISGKGLGTGAEPGPTTIGPDGVIQQGTPSGPPHEGSRETYEGRIISVPKDYCWTPCGAGKVLIGYKIWAYQREATNLANTVLQTSLRSHVKGSIIKHCYGDDAGKLGGFTSGTHNSWCTPKTWSETVFWESRNAVRDSDEWWMNRFNTWGVLDYKKDTNQYDTPAPQQIDPKMYVASAATMAGTAGTAGEGWSAGQAASTLGGYISRGAAFIGEGGMAASGLLAGGILLGSTSSTANPEEDQPFPYGIPPSTPTGPQDTSIPPSTPTGPQDTSIPPSSPTGPQDTSIPPSTPTGPQDTSIPPSTPTAETGPQITESRPISKYQEKAGIDPNVVRQTGNPCRALAKGKNGGGAYGSVGGHHMPANAISSLPEAWGPAIQIDPADHSQLSSTGARSLSPGMAAQGDLAQGDFLKAFDNDAEEIQSRFPGKYDDQIADARAYANCLKQNGLVK